MTGTDVVPANPRFLPLTGTLNTRDLGGVAVPGHGTTRQGVFCRSEIPMGLSVSDKGLPRELGLTTVIDLRQDHELERDANDLYGQVGSAYLRRAGVSERVLQRVRRSFSPDGGAARLQHVITERRVGGSGASSTR